MLKVGIQQGGFHHVFLQALRLKHIITSIDHVIQKVQDGRRGEKGIHMGKKKKKKNADCNNFTFRPTRRGSNFNLRWSSEAQVAIFREKSFYSVIFRI